MRNNTTGKYLDLVDYIQYLDGITVAKSYNYSLDELVELKDFWFLIYNNMKAKEKVNQFQKTVTNLNIFKVIFNI